MIAISKKLALATSLTAIVLGLGTGIAFASADTDTDGISPASTNFTASSVNVSFAGQVNGANTTVDCANSSLSGTTPASGSGLGPFNINDPSFTNCKIHGTNIGATITTNHTNGPWKLTFVDATSDEGIVIGTTNDEPAGHGTHTGDQIKVTIPKAGATFTSSAFFGCVITVEPTASGSISGTYDDVNKLSFSGASFTVGGNFFCSASSSAITGDYTSNVNIQDVSS